MGAASFASRLKAARALRGLTQEAAADALGIERKTIWYWESGNAVSPLIYVRQLARQSKAARKILARGLGLDR